ncbi:MAG TPA: bifunctional precorrin-2 dehydrogenase/sirohydrochlorin ferrochelatase [Bryobacteraceae bacterium]|nr:bifunctional precorrin-2 dehydrogenase/sirohydrochlorin ferrochelatase [Bryobacteraceae bacterium]
MSAYYPVLLKLEGKRCVVVGGGWDTDERVRALAEAGAQVTLICPAVYDTLEGIEFRHVRRKFQPGDLEGAFLVVSCPADRSENAAIWAEAEARGIPMNAVDDAPHCTFIFPAIHRQRDLIVTVSSSGKSPALASRIRDRLAGELGPEYADFLDLLGELRAEVIRRFPGFERRREIWYRLVDSEALHHLKSGSPETALQTLRNILDSN